MELKICQGRGKVGESYGVWKIAQVECDKVVVALAVEAILGMSKQWMQNGISRLVARSFLWPP